MQQPEDHDLTSPFEMHGHWWRQGAEETTKLPGCLSYTPEHGLQLQLFGSFKQDFQPPWKRRAKGSPIWGVVSAIAGRKVPVSLFDDVGTNLPNNPDASEKPNFHDIFFVNRAIVGTHALRPESLRFTSAEVSIPDLECFVGVRPFQQPPPLDDPEAFGIVYKPIKPVDIHLASSQTNMSIVSLADYDHRISECQLTLTYRYVVELKPAVPMPYEDCMEMIFKIVNFFALCSREGIHVRRIRGVLDSGENVAWIAMSRRQQRKPRPSFGDWLLTLKDIGGEQFPPVLNNWFELESMLGLMGDVFLSELAAPSHINDARFFHLAGCLEAYHRDAVRRDAGKFIPKPDYKKLRTELMKHVPQEASEALVASMQSALSHANDHTFGERVQELFESLDLETRSMLAEDQPRFLAALKQSRNRMAHISEDEEKEMFGDREYAHANVVLRAWMVMLLLKRCGVSEQVVRERMDRTGYLFWGPFRFNGLRENG